MNERFAKIARRSALTLLPALALVACDKGSNVPTRSNETARATAIRAEAQTPTSQASLLSPERQQFLKEAKKNNSGVIFVDVVDFDPQKSIFIDITEMEAPEGKIKDKITQQIYKPNTGQNSELIEAAITIKNCSSTYQIGVSLDGQNYYGLQFNDPQTGNVSKTFKINSQECFRAITIPVNTLTLPSPIT